jgi:hypothetical protein
VFPARVLYKVVWEIGDNIPNKKDYPLKREKVDRQNHDINSKKKKKLPNFATKSRMSPNIAQITLFS